MARGRAVRGMKIGPRKFDSQGISFLREIEGGEPILFSELVGDDDRPFEIDSRGSSIEEQAHLASLERLVRRLLDRAIQSERDRLIVLMAFGIGYPKAFTYDDVARHLGVTRGVVYSVLRSGMKKLRQSCRALGVSVQDI